ncbi:YlbL family protein [Allostreptomyces psammosilenae]|uniref:endopeptidase La n=1 Tax=Allostreptomyces psammosilenae TaxID=1892865 RepID=A0A852ZWE0_9ACTN|nr:PDZ domain-containing protein [Allostreptomyces psammosilenae]NYI06275.1 PDZ domain-containing protein [Allostreptomyces psammosilenae]
MPRRTATILTSISALVVILAALVLLPVPYAEMDPGPTFNTLGEDADGEEVITIAGHDSYEASGHLNMTTVRVTGKDYRMNLLEAVVGWLRDDSLIVRKDTLYPDDRSAEEVRQENAEEFSSSQEAAKAAALRQLGIDIGTQVIVSAVVDGAPAQDLLHAGDVIVAVDGTEVDSPEQVAELITAHRPGEDVVFTIVPKPADSEQPAHEDDPSARREVTVTTSEAEDGRAVVGIYPGTAHTFPFDIDIRLDDVGGPSAGLMFTLAIMDKLEPGDLTGGEFVAGTGTIDDQGRVGPIGGVQMKVIAAREAGAEYFLTPSDNCAAAATDPPDGLTLVRVDDLDGAEAALEDIRQGTTDELPLCGS